MHSTVNSVPAFLAKLWMMVDDKTTDNVICWGKEGKSFLIKHPVNFAQDILPVYYKHNNLPSFIRQLNMYGFHKVVSVNSGGLRGNSDILQFSHPSFLKTEKNKLEDIKRKVNKPDDKIQRTQSLSVVVNDVHQLRDHQNTIEQHLQSMKKENETLWKELALLRQQHSKQEQIINKLIRFLATIVHQNGIIVSGAKRRIPLMISSTQSPSKDDDTILSQLEMPSSSGGPTISDVTDGDDANTLPSSSKYMKLDHTNTSGNRAQADGSAQSHISETLEDTFCGNAGELLIPDVLCDTATSAGTGGDPVLFSSLSSPKGTESLFQAVVDESNVMSDPNMAVAISPDILDSATLSSQVEGVKMKLDNLRDAFKNTPLIDNASWLGLFTSSDDSLPASILQDSLAKDSEHHGKEVSTISSLSLSDIGASDLLDDNLYCFDSSSLLDVDLGDQNSSTLDTPLPSVDSLNFPCDDGESKRAAVTKNKTK